MYCPVCADYDAYKTSLAGGIAPNEVIARSEFEVHRQMFTE